MIQVKPPAKLVMQAVSIIDSFIQQVIIQQLQCELVLDSEKTIVKKERYGPYPHEL